MKFGPALLALLLLAGCNGALIGESKAIRDIERQKLAEAAQRIDTLAEQIIIEAEARAKLEADLRATPPEDRDPLDLAELERLRAKIEAGTAVQAELEVDLLARARKIEQLERALAEAEGQDAATMSAIEDAGDVIGDMSGPYAPLVGAGTAIVTLIAGYLTARQRGMANLRTVAESFDTAKARGEVTITTEGKRTLEARQGPTLTALLTKLRG